MPESHRDTLLWAPTDLGLVLDTGSGSGASVGVVIAGSLGAVQQLPVGTRSAQGLLPIVDQLLVSRNRSPQDIRWVALTTGPGSFTGLRVGLTFAKMLAMAGGVGLVAIDSCDALEASFREWMEREETVRAQTARLHTILDAQRGQLFARRRMIETKGNAVHLSTPTAIEIVNPTDWARDLTSDDWVCGPGLGKLDDDFWNSLASPPQVAPSELQLIDLAVLARLAVDRIDRKEWTDPARLVPNYQRRSAAEEKRDPR
ncbi:MAG: tRNA (adenosine(37)-N6)-threonylcarbamoyltransferase complex dimerization subunit type 1 TsaB [Planctomycetales bacterium]|nr:tRNA (adenosine(37)-N6)-threonylcarbamoyltransferase complex dimerization subunit type 1 TsaB [Planctomycetales bacterium]